jgi:hypothetical protein
MPHNISIIVYLSSSEISIQTPTSSGTFSIQSSRWRFNMDDIGLERISDGRM